MYKLIVAFIIALFTQFYLITEIPGLHFDEAWQGLFAHRIATESGFWPLSAMNSYTSPVLHYFLAFVFKIFNPTLLTMRVFLGLISIINLCLGIAFLLKIKKETAAVWFTVLWALLPLNVHLHRFFIELTSFHSFCLMLCIWGCVFFYENKVKLGTALFSIGYLMGVYAHILFVAILLTTILICLLLQNNPKQLSFRVFSILSFLTVPILIRMGLGLHKLSPYVLALGLICVGLFLLQTKFKIKAKSAKKLLRIILWISTPIILLFGYFFWDGAWPYAQVTGELAKSWIPINLILFLFVYFTFIKSKNKNTISKVFFYGSASLFILTSVLILKPTPRYYTTATIFILFWISIELETLLTKHRFWIAISAFVVWNAYAFNVHYISRFQNYGAVDKDIRHILLKDNARDFRPFQKAFIWTVLNNCQKTLRWVEDDRFLRQVEFLQLTVQPPTDACPWSKDDLLFSHGKGPHEPPYPHVNFLANLPQWGDLSFWIRKN